MASFLKSARPAQRKDSPKSSRSTKKSMDSAAPRSSDVQLTVAAERPTRPLPPKIVGELPVPKATFYL